MSPPDDSLDHYIKIYDCLKTKRHFIRVTGPHGEGLITTLLEALVSKQTPYRILELSLSWNQTSLATSLFGNMIEWPGEHVELKEIMIMGLAMNNVTVVRLLLENGVNLPSILTVALLEFLYGYRWYDDGSPLGFKINSRSLSQSAVR